MEKVIVYIHGKGGAASEALHYKRFFPDCDVIGFDYRSQTPWEASEEFPPYFHSLAERYESIGIIANSIGAYFALNSLGNARIGRAYFISPVVDMEQLITDMMRSTGVTEDELRERGTVETPFGETLSIDYLDWVRQHPFLWTVPTSVLYGGADNMQSIDTIASFTAKWGADLTVMENGEHWFHTEEQTAFLDEWLRRASSEPNLI